MQVSTSTTKGYAGSSTSGDNGDVNSCSVDINNIITVGNYQYIAYYGQLQGSPTNGAFIYLARRAVGTTTWSTPIAAINTNS